MRAESRGVYDTRASFTTGVGGVGQRVNRWSQRPSAATISRQKSSHMHGVCVCVVRELLKQPSLILARQE